MVRIGYVYHTYMKQKTLYPIFLKPDTGSCNLFTVSMNTFRIFAQNKKTMVKIAEMTYCDKLHKSLLKKEAVSPLEVIYNNHNQLGYNVVRRPAGQCLGNLKYFNLFYNGRFDRWYKVDEKQRVGKYFVITDYWKDRVRCFMVWNYGFGRYFPYNDFVEAMVYDYRRFGRLCKPRSKKAQEAEEKCVRFYVRSQIDMLRKEGYAAYRAKFKEERPQYFIGDDRTVFRCLDSSLKREEKIAACVAHKRALKEGIITSFINHLKKHPTTLYSWFSSEVDSEGKNRICLSDKAVSYLNKRLVRNGLKALSASYLFRTFRKMVKTLFGFNVRSFLNSCLMSVSTEEVLTKSMKKIVSKTVLFLYKRALKNYRRACGLKYDPDSGGLSVIRP